MPNEEINFVAIKTETSSLTEEDLSIAKAQLKQDVDTIDEMNSFVEVKSERRELDERDELTMYSLVESPTQISVPTSTVSEANMIINDMQFECVSVILEKNANSTKR